MDVPRIPSRIPSCYRVPKRLVKLAGEFGLEIELSFYGKP
jgi:hypothetical protein